MVVYDYYKEKNKKGVKGKLVAVIILTLFMLVGVIASNIYMEVIQLDEIGKLSSIYLTNIKYKIAFSAISFIIIFALVSITTAFIKRNIKKYLAENNLPARKLPNFAVAFIIALVGAFVSKDFFYLKAINFLNSASFGTSDPLFAKDIGYYVFQRPFYMSFYEFVSALWMFVIIYTAAYYLGVLASVFNNTITLQDLKIRTVVRHNLINIAIFFLIKTFSYKFQKEGLLYAKVVGVNGAGYVDDTVWLKYFEIVPYLLIAIVLTSIVFMWKGRLRNAAYSIAVFPAVWVIVTISAMLVQGFVVKPNEPIYESKYLKYNIQKTREAYDIDKIQNIEFPAMQNLTPEIINRNLETKNNIRIVDFQATLDSNIQLQSNTNFYNFHNGDIINYNINGKEIPVFITAREIDKNKLPDKSYINTKFKYTHGYGVVINPINKVTSEGQVDFILKDLKMDSVDRNLKVSEPKIYYGELTRDYVIVNPADSGKLKEIDYDGNTETNYTGKGGIKLGLLDRLLFALKFGDLNMIISNNVSGNSKILLNREILSRAQRAVPFLTVDPDPYIILTADGRLKWVIDAYTTTNYYPYSQDAEDYGNFNYIRNSVKIVVDAYDGEVKYYIIDNEDPIIKVYKKAYPEAFSTEPMPADIAAHMRYPELLFKVQTDMLKRYHVDPNNVSTFYSKHDLWEIARNPQHNDRNGEANSEAGISRDIDPYYNMIKLPQIGNKEELVLMRPFTPSGGKHNMVSWLAVRNSNENYGKMLLFTFPKNTNILGPYQVESNINSIDKVSKDMTLWGQSGSRVFKGNLLVIPIENSVLYVEPIYIQSAGPSSIPQVREIVVGYQKGEEFKYGIGTDLNSALNNLFSGIRNIDTAEPERTDQPATDNKVTTDNEKLINDIQSKVNQLQKQLDELNSMLNEFKGQ
ncbi:MAG: UPF0182 family protein [Clostridia bacterium]|nr:UPF0182 family protein [Clostridia bacterium]